MSCALRQAGAIWQQHSLLVACLLRAQGQRRPEKTHETAATDPYIGLQDTALQAALAKAGYAPWRSMSRCMLCVRQALGIEERGPKAHLDVRSKLKGMTMEALPHGLLPTTAAADALATKRARLSDKGIATPFVFADLKDFRPHWCTSAGQ